MIPKIIHYCWFGRGEKPKLAEKCIESWKKFCPDYEIIEWNEDNFDINRNGYTQMCYREKKWAFLTDYVRLAVVEAQGGIYMDTDVELLKSPSALLDAQGYIGFETESSVNTGMGFGSVAHGAMVQAMLRAYAPYLDGTHGVTMCPALNTQALETLGLKKNGQLQRLSAATVYPIDWFNPYDSLTGRLKKTENTVSVHWYAGACLTKTQKLRRFFSKPIHRIFGVPGSRK